MSSLMKKTIIRFGLYGALAEVVFFFVSLMAAGVTKANYDVLTINCYPAIVISLSFTYFGIRYYRDTINNGAITFASAFTIGILIVLIPAVCFGFSDTIYNTVLDPHFYDRLEADKINGLRQTVTAVELPARVRKLKGQMDFYKTPWINFAIMFLTVTLIGAIVSLIAASMLQGRPRKTNHA
jgi:hypothetical protein